MKYSLALFLASSLCIFCGEASADLQNTSGHIAISSSRFLIPESFNCSSDRLEVKLVNKEITLDYCVRSSSADEGSKESTGVFPNLASILDQSPAVLSSLYQLDAAKFQLKSAQGAWWPSISMSNSSILFTDIQAGQNYGGSPNSPSSPGSSGTAFNPFNGSTSRDGIKARLNGNGGGLVPWSQSYSRYTQAYPVIQLQWNFLNPTRYPQIAAAKKQLKQAEVALEQAKRTNRQQLQQAYGMARYAGFNIAEILKIINVQKEILSEIEAQVEARVIPRMSINQAYSDLLSYQNQLQLNLLKQENALAQIKSLLWSRTNQSAWHPIAKQYLLTALSKDFPLVIQQWPETNAETYRLAVHYSTQLAQTKLQAGINRDNANAQWGGILPTVGILAYSTYQYTWGSQNYVPPDQPNGAQSGSFANYAGLSFSWNIFDGYATRNQAIAYEKMAASSEMEYVQQKSQLDAQVASLMNQLNINKRSITLALENLVNSDRIKNDVEARKEAGLNTFVDFYNAEIAYLKARLLMIEAVAVYDQAYQQLASLCNLNARPGLEFHDEVFFE